MKAKHVRRMKNVFGRDHHGVKGELTSTEDHNHDSRYYTESEIDSELSGKSDTDHNHNDTYYTEAEVDSSLAGKADSSHTHVAGNISNFDAEVSNNTDVAANTSARHDESHTVASHSDTTATGAQLNTLVGGGETALHSHAGGGGISEYMYPVWAEENAAIAANAHEWAFGNGANTPADGGMTIYVPSGWTAQVVAMSLRIGSGTATVQLKVNGVDKGNDCNVAVSSGQSATNDSFTPVSLSNNDYINFRTQAASGSSGPNVVTAWIKMTES